MTLRNAELGLTIIVINVLMYYAIDALIKSKEVNNVNEEALLENNKWMIDNPFVEVSISFGIRNILRTYNVFIFISCLEVLFLIVRPYEYLEEYSLNEITTYKILYLISLLSTYINTSDLCRKPLSRTMSYIRLVFSTLSSILTYNFLIWVSIMVWNYIWN